MKRFYSLTLFIVFSIFLTTCTFADTIYTIKKGDSLYKISRKFGVTINEIKNKNKITSSRIKPGTEIVVPTKDKKQDTTLHASSVKRNSLKPNTVDKASVNTAEDETHYYTVKKGDTLSAIARRYSISISEIREINDLRSTKLKPGQKLLVKQIGLKTYIVRKGETIYGIARKFNVDVDDLKDINGLETDLLKPGQKLLLEPEEEMNKIASYEAILSEAQIEKEIKEVSESEEPGLKDKLILFAKKFINIPYRFGGNSIFGIDCSGYVQKVYSIIGISLPRSARQQFSEGEPVNSGELSIGDLVFFRTYAPFPSHVGIYLGNDLFIHASSKEKKVTIDSLIEPYYIKRFIGARRVIGEETIDGG